MKFKKIPNDYCPTLLDRLSRFEPAYIRLKRVFDDIINKFSIDKKAKLLNLSQELELVEEILTASFSFSEEDRKINQLFLELEDKYFYKNELSYHYLSCKIPIYSILKTIELDSNSPKNLIWLKNLTLNDDIFKARNEKSLLYPIEKIILCEGETEKILFCSILKLFNIDFDKLGFILIPAGGKNQVARKYYSMVENTKLPFFILLDKDAILTSELIKKKLRNEDRIYIINSGEFEDLIPAKIFKSAINFIHKNELNCTDDDFKNSKMVENLENIYKKYGFGEYKKAQFALFLKDYIEKYCTKQDFISSEIKNIASLIV